MEASEKPGKRGWGLVGGVAAALVGLAAFLLYLRTLAPTVLYYDLPYLRDAAVLQVKAAVLGVYGGLDARINANAPATKEALERANIRHTFLTYEGANHAFHNDTGANYVRNAAESAWSATLAWFKTYV